MIWMLYPHLPLPTSPVAALEPFRIANRYGLFAVMTRGRYEIEFQGSNDGEHWETYPFPYKPQNLDERPRIYAPYQPRFDWNLWFASLGSWRENMIVPSTEERLLAGAPDVLALFRRKSISALAAKAGARRALAILVHDAGGEARDRRVVAARIARSVCTSAGAGAGWHGCSRLLSAAVAAAPMTPAAFFDRMTFMMAG